jgi:hypothetical protein
MCAKLTNLTVLCASVTTHMQNTRHEAVERRSKILSRYWSDASHTIPPTILPELRGAFWARSKQIEGGLKESRSRVKTGFLAGVAEWQTRWIQNGLARLEATLLPHVVFR